MQDELLLGFYPEDDESELDAGLDPDLVVWAPIHAWRALGQLKAVEFLQAALPILKEYELDWAWDEFPKVLQLIGPPVIESLGAIIAAETTEDLAAGTLIEGLQRIAEQFPETRDRCVTLLTNVLQEYAQNEDSVNAALISALLKLKAATESLALIEAAYQAEKVDEFYAGTWAQIQVELGLKTKADFTEAELTPKMPTAITEMRKTLEPLERMRKPDAFSLGLPLDPSTFPSTKPPAFDDMLISQSATIGHDAKKGFGGSQTSSKKSKKKKKR
ncbi:MAG: hypothetical protein F6K42_19015 [Leptolyngbya sp. SIO1D8]|nr:hypothetical protein [Leptolyngbya sp. SIO1D8]